MEQFTELEWENLITFIQEGRVIPILGSQLSMVNDPVSGEPILFDQWLASELAAKLPAVRVEPGASLNTVVVAALQSGASKLPGLVATLKRIIANHPFETPEALQLLAGIGDLRLFLTTAIDPLLEQALANSRPKSPAVLCYGPRRMEDLPVAAESLPCATVYHLFGRPDSPSGGAICEEDIVEWLTGFQSPTHSPERLCAAMESSHLLLIGLGFDGWLARFFLRAAKRQPLRDDRDNQEYLADPAALADGELVLFLQSMSKTTLLVEGTLTPLEFVKELHRRWQHADFSDTSPQSRRSLSAPVRFLPPEREMPEDAVFISYSRTDLEFAKRLKGMCDQKAITTWFDIDRLDAGDSYARIIQSNIERCRFFIPVISAAALSRTEAFFYMEWDWALARKRKMAPGSVFILPVIIGEVDRNHRRIPEPYTHLDMPVFIDGVIPDSFIERLANLLNGN